jgi:hypothetical protein
MSDEPAKLSNPFSTGGGGHNFENSVQSAFVVLMLSGGVVPCLPALPIKQIILQGKYAGYDTDDFIVFVESQDGKKKAKLLAQIKHSISFTENDSVFGEVMQSAWRDFQNDKLFDRETDAIAIITGLLSAHDIENVRVVLERARHTPTVQDFLDQMILGKFTSDPQRKKLEAFRTQLKAANKGVDVSDEQLWQFLNCFHMLGFDLDIKSGVTLSLLNSHIAQFKCGDVTGIWAKIAKEVASFNQNAGTITLEKISKEIKAAFSEHAPVSHIPKEFLKELEAKQTADFSKGESPNAIALASLLGSWNEKTKGDMEVIKRLFEQ